VYVVEKGCAGSKPPTPSTKLPANYVQLIVWVWESLWRRAWRSSHGRKVHTLIREGFIGVLNGRGMVVFGFCKGLQVSQSLASFTNYLDRKPKQDKTMVQAVCIDTRPSASLL